MLGPRSKTKISAQGAPGQPSPDTSNVCLRDQALETVESFPYLGSYLSNDCTAQKDIENRIRAAHAAFGRLSKRVFLNHDLNLHTKIMVFQAIVLSTLLYGSEVWVLYRSDIKKLERFQQQKLRAILKVKWQDLVTNETVLLGANLPSIETTMARHRLRWAGHVRRMPAARLPRQILFSQLEHGAQDPEELPRSGVSTG
ncbi:Hypp3484 [Branchiostoma lanceolatum]|uniref:Hypp3484 protein n=1 Tax=Branchiostoma lanceolatum TaxID=7740 RepID=A0A8J9ZZY6_BRALA|nr:Hypp3484 [Branchiostoma lanceolatum]